MTSHRPVAAAAAAPANPPSPPHHRETRHSRRVRFAGGNGFDLAGIVDLPLIASPKDSPEQRRGDSPEQPLDDSPGPAAFPRPDGSPVVVLSHCFTCNKDLKALVRIGRALAGAGVTVLRYDMTGLGGSDGDFSHTNFTSNLADLRAAIAWAQATLGPVTGLLGHSFGGAATLALGGSPDVLPRSVGGIATLAAPSDTAHLADLLVRMNPAIETQGHGEVEIGGRRWTIRREMLADFRRHRLTEQISRIAAPLLVLHSPVDRTLGFDHAVRILSLASRGHDRSTAPAVSLLALDGADHLLADNPADTSYVAGVLAAFFWRHRPDSSTA